MKLFGRSGGYYLFWTGFVYLVVGVICAVTQAVPSEYVTLGFLLALCVPLCVPPVARYFNMEPMMFDWFSKKKYSAPKYPTWNDVPAWDADMKNVANDMNKVLPFPELKSVHPDAHKVEQPKAVNDQPCYQVGKTEDGSTTLRLGTAQTFTTLTMNNQGVDTLIRMLEAAKEPEHDDSNPVDEETTA